MIAGMKGLGLVEQTIDELLAGANGKRRDVIDGFFGIEFRALAAGPVENVDDLALDVEQAQLEYGEQPARSAADDDGIRENDFGTHCPRPCVQNCFSGTRTVSPSSASVTLIWHDSRL